MKTLLNTLYVTTQGAYLAKDGEAVAVRIENETKLHIPVHNLGSIVCFGQVSCSPFVLGLCAERGVTVVFLTERGRFLARVCGPTTGNVNALLSFVYTLMRHDIVGGLESVGLDPAVGFLHRDRPGRPSLALDLLEEFRPYVADRLVLGLVNLRQVSERDFERTESGGVVMRDEARKLVLVSYQKRKQEEVVHPFLGERVAVGLLFHLQALLLARYLRGVLDPYPAF